MRQSKSICKIALSGGPGAGKTTAAELLRRELGDQIIVVAEAATTLFKGGFPRSNNHDVTKLTQKTIYNVQKNLEDIQRTRFPDRVLLCDRGTVDSSIYWPSGQKDFFQTLNTNLDTELNSYSAVVFFETAAVGNISIEGGNRVRTETMEEAIALDKKLREVWSKHPNYYFIPHNVSFLQKIIDAHICIKNIIKGMVS